MSDPLAAWLQACIAEDEVAARAATQGPWRHNPAKEWHTDPERLAVARTGRQFVPGGEEFVGAGPRGATIGVAATGPSDDPQSMADAAHIARWDPVRVLAECAAKLAILDAYAAVLADNKRTWDAYSRFAEGRYVPDEEFARGTDGKATAGLRVAVHALAQPYVDRPGFDPAWRVGA